MFNEDVIIAFKDTENGFFLNVNKQVWHYCSVVLYTEYIQYNVCKL